MATCLAGCVSIKSQSTAQRAPGVVELRGVVCANDYDAGRSPDCQLANVAERDNGTGEAELTGLGQLLVGFRVPAGTTPPESFPSDARDVSFSASPSYTAALEQLFPPAASERWFGYISTAKRFNPAAPGDRVTGFRPEFGLPPRPDGVPSGDTFPWRLVVGFRQLADAGQAGNDVSCSGFHHCADSPPNNPPSFPANLQAPVSDFGLPAAAGAATLAGQTATVAFPLRYADGGGLGAQDVRLSATTDVPAGSATPAASTVSVAPDSASGVDVQVAVPPATPPGSYAVTLTAAVGSPPVTRSRTATLVVAPPPPARDGDGDGVPDPSDRCPATPRGAFDADGDGCVGPYARITATTSGTWEVGDRGVTIGSMRVKGLPAGARVELRCAGCRRQTLTARRSTVNLGQLRGKRLRRGSGFTVKVTRTGFVGERVALTVKRYGHRRSDFRRVARRPFRIQRRCIPVGASRPAASCTATPPTGP